MAEKKCARATCFTVNNYDDDDVERVKNVECLAICVAKETGDSGTPHLQGCVYFKNRRSLAGYKKAISDKVHIETMRGTWNEASEYCRKEGEIIRDFGTGPEQGKRNDIVPFRDAIIAKKRNFELVDEFPNECAKFPRFIEFVREAKRDIQPLPAGSRPNMGVWLWGVSDTGKTTQFPHVYYDKPCNKWWDQYDDEEYVMIDDPAPEWSNHLAGYIKQWVQEKPFIGEYKGGARKIRFKKVIILANMEPAAYFKERWFALQGAFESRFKVVEVNSREEVQVFYSRYD